MKKQEIWSFIGAGGKSTLILETAEKKVRQGEKVLIATTTHTAFTREEFCRAGGVLFLDGDGGAAARALDRFRLAGAFRVLPGEPGKQQGLTEEEFQKAATGADLVLVEADGSRRRPFKAPAEYEPALRRDSSRIFLIAGLTALYHPIGEGCHRTEEIRKLTGRGEEELLREEDMAEVIRKGYLKKCRELLPGIPVTVILNQADTEKERSRGRRVRELLTDCGAEVFLFSAGIHWEGKDRWNMG